MIRHGHARPRKGRTLTYISWNAMWQRCTDPNAANYKFYGGRGVSICPRWSSYESFLEDMGEKPAGTSLDRFPDNGGNYEPGNCRWATAKQQANNRRRPQRRHQLSKEIDSCAFS